jgi:diguanylate cyclase (GGDEF)-like protein
VAVFFLVVAGSNLLLGLLLGMYLSRDAAVQIRYLPAPISAAPAPAAREKPAVATADESDSPMPVAPAPAVVAPPGPSVVSAAQPSAESLSAPSKLVGASIAEFKSELSRYRDQLSALDKRMRIGAEAQDAVAIKECLTTLRSANDQYLDQQSEASGRLQRHCDSTQFEPINRQLGAALNQQVAQMKSSNQQLEDVDLENNLLNCCQKLLDETSRLVDANHAMRDALDDVELQLARTGGQPMQPGDLPVGNLISRVQLEAALADWWKDDSYRRRPLAIGLVDLDRLRELNESHGLSVGDRILDAAALVVGAALRGTQRGARMSAQKFLLMFPDMPAREATNVLERIRQQLESTRFESGSSSISITLSCSVAETAPDDTMSTLLSRVETTLQEAKRYGRNRTFLHDGKFPAPVVPPVLSVESRTLTI